MNYKNLYTKFALLTICLSAFSAVALADVKIKSKQTAGGQSFENTTYIKGKRQRTETMNGALVNLTQCDLRRGVQINQAAKTYLVNEFETTQAANADSKSQIRNPKSEIQKGGLVSTTITTRDTGERRQMFGFTARHLIITMETVSSPDACAVNNNKMEFDGWYIDAEFALDCDQNMQYGGYQASGQSGCQDKFQIKQVGTAKRGYPVYEKMTMFDAGGKETFSTVNEVVELSKTPLDAALFEIPADFREVTDSSQIYASNSGSSSGISSGANSSVDYNSSNNSGMSANIKNMAQNSADLKAEVGAKKAGVVRVGLAGVKTGAVGEGLKAADLAAAVQNSLVEYLKVPNVELVHLDARLPAAIDAEAKEKECDFIIYAGVSHKKGGGGGGFGGMFGKVVGQTGIGSTGSTAGNIATTAIVSAGSMSENVKSKDEITLDIKLQNPAGGAVLTKQYKAKAKSNGEDIITPVVEQAAQAIFDAVSKQ